MKRRETNFLHRQIVKEEGEIALNCKNGLDLGSMLGRNFILRGGEAVAQGAQRSCGGPIPGRLLDQVGWDNGQAVLVCGNTAHGRAFWN